MQQCVKWFATKLMLTVSLVLILGGVTTGEMKKVEAAHNRVVVDSEQLFSTDVVNNYRSVNDSRFTGTGASEVKETTAKISTKLSPAADITETGFYLGKSSSNMKQYREVGNTKGCIDIWYNLGTGKWTGALERGTTYYYQLYAVTGGVTYKTSVRSFTTTKGTTSDFPFKDGQTYIIKSALSGKAIEVSNGTSNKVSLNVWSYTNDPWQRWTVKKIPEGYVFINAYTGQAMDIKGNSTEDGAQLIQYPYDSTSSVQKFKVFDYGDGKYGIISIHSGRAVDLYASNKNDGTLVKLYEWHGAENQLWTFTPYDTEKPNILSVNVTDVDCTGYTVWCDVVDNVGVSHVNFPSWTLNNGQDDLGKWPQANQPVSGNIYSYRVNTADHNYELGEYTTHVYAYDDAGLFDCEAIPVVNVWHVPVTDYAVAPTCTSTGLTEGSHCAVCNTVLVPQTVVGMTEHSYDSGVVTQAATCTAEGVKTYTCQRCGATKQETINRTAHDFKTRIIPAKPGKDGETIATCKNCGEKTSQIICRPAKIKLSNKEYVYNGKVRKPAVYLIDQNGSVIDKNNYKMTYGKNNIKPGIVRIKINLKANYRGQMSTEYLIKPVGTSFTKVSPYGKALKLSWDKQTKETTGYQLQYSTKSSFPEHLTKTATCTRNTITGCKLTKLQAGTKYYVRIRTYKLVTVDGVKTRIFSDWSKVKSAKTK